MALDNEDLRFECARLTASLERAQQEILALTERCTTLQHRLDRIHRLAPRGSRRLLSFVKSVLGRR